LVWACDIGAKARQSKTAAVRALDIFMIGIAVSKEAAQINELFPDL
jgi:hypothetical protein